MKKRTRWIVVCLTLTVASPLVGYGLYNVHQAMAPFQSSYTRGDGCVIRYRYYYALTPRGIRLKRGAGCWSKVRHGRSRMYYPDGKFKGTWTNTHGRRTGIVRFYFFDGTLERQWEEHPGQSYNRMVQRMIDNRKDTQQKTGREKPDI